MLISSTDKLTINVKSRVLEECCKRNSIPTRRLDHHTLLVQINGKWLPFFNMNGPSSSAAIRRILDYKHLTLGLLKENGFSVSDYMIFDKTDIKHLLQFAKTRYPIVLKPINGRMGKGVIIGIRNEQDLIKAVDKFETPSGWGLAEKYFEGNDYRAVVVDGTLISVTKRERAHVIGDGKSTILQLIQSKNSKRPQNQYYKDRQIPTAFDKLYALKDAKLQLESIPADGQKVMLNYTANMHSGGESINHINIISTELKEIIVGAVKSIPGLNYTGLDLLVKNPKSSKPEYVILEMNFTFGPTAMFHTIGEPVDVVKPILDYYINYY